MAFVRIAIADRVERWTIERHERGNALGTTIAAELNAALTALRARIGRDNAPRALVIGAEPVVKGARRTWVAGGDLKELAALGDAAAARAYAASLATFLDSLDELPIPVLMAVDGAAIGGGAELALGGDVRLAARGSLWEWKQLRVGLTTGYAGCGRLLATVGYAHSQGIIFLGETLDCDEALRLGLTHRVTPTAGGLGALVDTVLTDLLALAPEAFAAQKAMLRLHTAARPAAAELDLFAGVWRNPSHARFLAAFTAKGGGSA